MTGPIVLLALASLWTATRIAKTFAHHPPGATKPKLPLTMALIRERYGLK